MPLDFDTFLICVLAIFGGISFFAHRRRRTDYSRRLGDSATSIPLRSTRTLLLLSLLGAVALAGIVLGSVQLATGAGAERLTGLIAIAGAILFFATAYRESTPLVGQHGFAIPYFNLFLPWSAIEEIAYPMSDATITAGTMTIFYRSGHGTKRLQLRLGRRTGSAAGDVVERYRREHDEGSRVAVADSHPVSITST